MQNKIIKVNNLKKIFKVPHEQQNSLKSKAVNIFSSKKYTKYSALDNISFEIEAGEFFGIVGKNGCGKSTLLKILANIYQPSSGEVSVGGTIAPFIELGVGFNPELTGRENVFLSGTILGLSRKKIEQLYDEIVEFAELSEFMDQKLKNYSSGMQVRLAFSIAIRSDSDILLIDEVLAVGDSSFQRKCFNFFVELKKTGRTVVFVTHDMSAVERFCDRAIIIEAGKIKLEGRAIDIADLYRKDNMDKLVTTNDNINDKSRPGIKVTTKSLSNNTQDIVIEYNNPKRKKVYVGFSIIRDGFTFAEMNNLGKESNSEKKRLVYSLPKQLLNSGSYEVSAALIDLDTEQVLSFTNNKAQFSISGYSKKYGGAMKLPSNKW